MECNYDQFSNEIPFVGNILMLQFEPVFTAEKYLAGISA